MAHLVVVNNADAKAIAFIQLPIIDQAIVKEMNKGIADIAGQFEIKQVVEVVDGEIVSSKLPEIVNAGRKRQSAQRSEIAVQ